MGEGVGLGVGEAGIGVGAGGSGVAVGNTTTGVGDGGGVVGCARAVLGVGAGEGTRWTVSKDCVPSVALFRPISTSAPKATTHTAISRATTPTIASTFQVDLGIDATRSAKHWL